MKKLTTLMIGCALMLAGAAFAQQPEEQASPGATVAGKTKGHAGEAKPEGKPKSAAMPEANPAVRPEVNAAKHEAPVLEQHGGKHAAEAPKQEKTEATPKAAIPAPSAAMTPASQPVVTATPAVKSQAEKHGKGAKAPAENASVAPIATATPAAKATPAKSSAASATPAPTAAASATATATTAPVKAPSASPSATATAAPSASASASPAASASVAAATPAAASSSPAAPLPTPKPNTAAATKKPDVQKVQEIKTEHANFTAQPNPQLAPAVTFTPNYRVEGSDHWQGPQYEAYRSYRPERHDESYYRSHYDRVELISGGYYYQRDNYWYPAWGYSPRHEYYAYNGPIYVGHRSERLDRVIADVQAVLKDMGYYRGQVDGLLGPLTREALIGYQEDSGLTATAVIDEPTLDSLNMGS